MASFILAGDISGSITLQAPSVSGNTTLALPATSGTLFASVSTGWSIIPIGTTLYFAYNGINIAKLDSSGNFTALANVTANNTV